LFGASQPFSFANVALPKKDEGEAAGDAGKEDEEPPKNEFVPVVEENRIYEQRCKVFIKQSSDYSDRGVGKLPEENR
jgi:nuclear pore complex protein Nup50